MESVGQAGVFLGDRVAAGLESGSLVVDLDIGAPTTRRWWAHLVVQSKRHQLADLFPEGQISGTTSVGSQGRFCVGHEVGLKRHSHVERMDVHDALHELRSSRPNIPVTIMRGCMTHELLGRFDGLGAFAFLQKPLGCDILLEQVRIARGPSVA